MLFDDVWCDCFTHNSTSQTFVLKCASLSYREMWYLCIVTTVCSHRQNNIQLSNRFQGRTLKGPWCLLRCQMSECECSCCPCCSEVADHCRWVDDQSQFVPCSLRWRGASWWENKRVDLPEAAETVDTTQPAGGHSADQHKNNSTTVVKETLRWRRGEGTYWGQRAQLPFCCSGKEVKQVLETQSGCLFSHMQQK